MASPLSDFVAEADSFLSALEAFDLTQEQAQSSMRAMHRTLPLIQEAASSAADSDKRSAGAGPAGKPSGPAGALIEEMLRLVPTASLQAFVDRGLRAPDTSGPAVTNEFDEGYRNLQDAASSAEALQVRLARISDRTRGNLEAAASDAAATLTAAVPACHATVEGAERGDGSATDPPGPSDSGAPLSKDAAVSDASPSPPPPPVSNIVAVLYEASALIAALVEDCRTETEILSLMLSDIGPETAPSRLEAYGTVLGHRPFADEALRQALRESVKGVKMALKRAKQLEAGDARSDGSLQRGQP